jgi:flagellar motor switch/type III secretory pathway protein FliN
MSDRTSTANPDEGANERTADATDASVPASVSTGDELQREQPRTVDLTGRDRQLRAAMTLMARVAVDFTRRARRTLPFLVARKTHLMPQPVAIASAPGELSSAPGPGLHAFYEDENGPAWASVSLNAVSLGLILEGALGGAHSAAGSYVFGAELTLAQRALAGRLIRSLGEDLLSSFKAEAQLQLTPAGIYATPTDSLEHVERRDGLSVDCIVEGVEGASIRIAAQAAALDAAIKDTEEDEPPHGDPKMAQVVRDVPVTVIVELGRITMGLSSLLRLKRGQVLRLPTAVDDAVNVEVAGIKKFVGTPVTHKGQLAVQLTERCDD